MIKKFKVTLLVTMMASMAALTACNKSQEPAAAQQQMPKTVVDVQTIQLTSIPVVQTFSGRVAAIETADVRPQATGVIDEVLFREGSTVRAGQPLYRINIDSYVSNVESGRAAVANAQSGVDNALAGVKNAQSGVQNAQAVRQSAIANLKAQEAALAQARADLARLDGLLQAEAISRQAHDQAVTAVRTAEANVAAARASVNQAEASINSARASLDSAQASVGSARSSVGAAQANLNASQLDINRTIVRAPISGQTGISSVTAGALVAANQANALVTITRTDQVYVDISQSSAEMLRLREQMMSGRASQGSSEVQLVLEDGSTYPQTGRLALQDARVNESSGATTLRAIFSNQSGILIPGMYTNARLIQSVMHNAALLPQSAMMRTPRGEAQVYVVNSEAKIEVRNVTTSGTYDGKWIVTDGLANGDRVVIMGGAKVKPEQEVDVRELPPTANEANAAAQGTAQSSTAKPAATKDTGTAQPKAGQAPAAVTPMARPPAQATQSEQPAKPAQ